MIRVKLSTNFPDWPLIKQTPGCAGVWGGCRFFINEDVDECDFWVVYDDVLRPETTRCPPENTLLITGEPPSVKLYPRRFAAQFATVLTCQRELKHPHVIYGQQALPWHVKVKSYDELKLSSPEKTKNISIISSDKAFTEGHRRRIEFAQKLKERLGDELDYFGKGVRTPKYETTASYRYSVVIENSHYSDYWTEKLADAFLLDTYPFYCGCLNIGEYFSKDAFSVIDISDFDASLETIQTAIQKDAYASTYQARQAAKALVLDKYNMFAVIDKLVREVLTYAPPRPMTVLPSPRYSVDLVEAVKKRLRPFIRRNK